MQKELQLPPNVASDPNATELVRAWASRGGLVCSLNPAAWPEDQAAIAWGILLSDIARHVADALHQTNGLEKSVVLSRVRSVFDTELDRPSGQAKGKFV